MEFSLSKYVKSTLQLPWALPLGIDLFEFKLRIRKNPDIDDFPWEVFRGEALVHQARTWNDTIQWIDSELSYLERGNV